VIEEKLNMSPETHPERFGREGPRGETGLLRGAPQGSAETVAPSPELDGLRAALAERTRETQQAQAEVVFLRAQLYEHHLQVIANLKAENEALRRELSRKTAEEGEPEAVG
jgi:hypothetical protein